MVNGVPKAKTNEAAGGGGGGGAAVTVMVATPWICSVVVPSGSVAVAVSVSVAVPAPTLVMIAPFGVLGSAATVKTVESELVY